LNPIYFLRVIIYPATFPQKISRGHYLPRGAWGRVICHPRRRKCIHLCSFADSRGGGVWWWLKTRGQIFKRLRTPGIGSKESIPPGYISLLNRLIVIDSWIPSTFKNSGSTKDTEIVAKKALMVKEHHQLFMRIVVYVDN
jgi:hypothetical protein